MKALLVVVCGLLVAADDKDDVVKKEKTKLKGTYTMVSGEEQGTKLPEGFISIGTIEFTNDKMIIKGKGKSEATYKIDPSQKPKTIDLTPQDGSEKGKLIKGIYVIDGGTLTICTATKSDNDRPTEFATKKGSGSVLMVLKKEKEKK
jgi:uncharacterized protein (TIGR03067 family)